MPTVTSGMPVEAVIEKVKNAIVYTGVSQETPGRDLRVAEVQLILRVVATESGGGGLTFRVPIVGMELKAGATITRKDTHTIDIALKPPASPGPVAIRGGDIERTLVDAIDTIRAVMASAAAGKDPWVVSASTVDISFVVTKESKISLGVEGELGRDITQTLRLSLVPT
jgi:hypothetical protein